MKRCPPLPPSPKSGSLSPREGEHRKHQVFPRPGNKHLRVCSWAWTLRKPLTPPSSQIRCMLNIWGVILYLRLPWITAQAGIGECASERGKYVLEFWSEAPWAAETPD